MAILQNSAEGGTDGVTVSAANSGGGSGNAWDSVNFGTGNIQFDDDVTPLHDTMAYRLAPSSNQVTELRWDGFAAQSTGHVTAYFRIPSAYTVTSTIIQMRHSGGNMASLHITNNPRVIVRNRAGTGIFNSASANISLDTWYRLELLVTKGTGIGPSTSDGVIRFALYPGDSLIAAAEFNSTTADTGINDLAAMYIGRNSQFTTDVTVTHFDSVTLYTGSDVTGLNKPWTPIAPPAANTNVFIWDGAAWVESEDGIQVFNGSTWEF